MFFRISAITTLLIAAVTLACSSYSIQRRTRHAYPRVVAPEDIRIYADPVPDADVIVLATVDSDSATTISEENQELMLSQLRDGASRAGAQAVYDVQVVTLQKRGIVRDPTTPFPSITQGWTDYYVLRGVAILSEGDRPEFRPSFITNPGHPAPDDLKEADLKPVRDHLAGPSPHANPLRSVEAPSWNNTLKANGQ